MTSCSILNHSRLLRLDSSDLSLFIEVISLSFSGHTFKTRSILCKRAFWLLDLSFGMLSMCLYLILITICHV